MGVCTFEFAQNSPLRTTLLDKTTGHAKYQIDTPRRITGSTTRIRKLALPPQSPLIRDGEASSDPSDEDPTDEGKKGGFHWRLTGAELPETADEIARIHWKCFSTDRIKFLGNATTRKEFLPKAGKKIGSYKFTGPDGIEYMWVMGSTGGRLPELVTTDEKKTVIAQFYRASCFSRKRKARLEIQPEGMKMLDHVILTFVIVEQRRRERESAKHSGGG